MRTTSITVLFTALAAVGCGTADGDAPVNDGGGAAHDAGGEDAGAMDDGGPQHGDAGSLSPCLNDVAVGPDVRVFVTGSGTLTSQPGQAAATIAGTVTELGFGALPSGTAAGGWPGDGTKVHWLRIAADGGSEWIVAGARLPSGFAVQQSSAVSAEYYYYFGGWSPDLSALSLHVGGALAFYFGKGADPGTLPLLDEVHVSLGEALCKVETDCGDYAQHEVRISLGGESATFGTQQEKTLGDYDVWHPRTARQLPGPTPCSDWFVSDSAVVVTNKDELFAAPGASCHVTSFSTLPGVHIEVDDSACKFTLAQAMQGITFDYQVVVDHDVEGVTPEKQDAGRCQSAHASGLYLGERIAGGSERYCICDTGLCQDVSEAPKTLTAGAYPGTFSWDGHNWEGPSDTSNPKGPLFPAGTYTFEVKASGLAAEGAFDVRGGLTFTLE